MARNQSFASRLHFDLAHSIPSTLIQTTAFQILGIKQKIEPTPPTEANARTLDQSQTLPVAFEVSLTLLEEETALHEILGEGFVKAYVGIKRKEFETFFRVISSWEREYLLLNV